MDVSKINQIAEDLKRDEGRVVHPKTGNHVLYKCPAGLPTIGYGRNLKDNPLTSEEQIQIFGVCGCQITEDAARYLLEQDIKTTWVRLLGAAPWVGTLSDNRKRGIINMAFQLGVSGFLKFEKAITQIRSSNWSLAAEKLKQSLWYLQTPERAERVINLIEKG